MKVHSSGVWGHTSQDVLKRLPSALQSAFTEGGRLAFVLILVGTNDLLHSHPHQLDYQIPNIINNIRAICETAANAAFFPHVGVLTLPPLASRNPARLRLNQQIRHFMAGYAAQKGLSERFLVDLESLNPSLAQDGVHFNDESSRGPAWSRLVGHGVEVVGGRGDQGFQELLLRVVTPSLQDATQVRDILLAGTRAG